MKSREHWRAGPALDDEEEACIEAVAALLFVQLESLRGRRACACLASECESLD
jgi:hypothetical protein